MAKTTVEVPTFDPFTTYEIMAHNKKYTGDICGIRFTSGKGVLPALEKGADDEELAEHIGKLFWFHNAEPATVFVPDEEGKPQRKHFPGYVITAQGRAKKEAVTA